MLKVKKETIDTAVEKVLGIVERSSLREIHSNVLISAADDTLKLTTTDGIMHMTAECQVELNGDSFSLCTSARKLGTILKNMLANEISLSVKEKLMHIRSSKSSAEEKKGFKLSTRSAEDFPRETSSDSALSVDLEQDKFLKSLKRVQACISQKTHRLYMAGLCCDFTDDGLNIVATDSHRLSKDTLPCGDFDKINIIVPRKAVMQLLKLLKGEAKEAVKFSVVKDGSKFRLVRFSLPGLKLSAQLIDGSFPNYEQVIPESNDVVAVFNRDDFRAQLDQACAIHDKQGETVTLALDVNSANLSAKGSQSSDEASHDMDVEYSSEPMKVNFNSTFLKDMVSAFDGFDRIEMKFKDTKNTVVCLSADKKSALRYVLMPVHF